VPIRRARAADVPAIRRCVRDAYAVYLDRLDRPPAPLGHDVAAQVAAGRVFVERGAALRGVLVVVPAPDHLEIENLAVRPEHQGQGVGRRLLAFAERRARTLGLSEVRLYTHEKMVENQRYYAARGYRELRRGIEDGYARVFYAKPLRAVSRPRSRSPRSRSVGAGDGIK